MPQHSFDNLERRFESQLRQWLDWIGRPGSLAILGGTLVVLVAVVAGLTKLVANVRERAAIHQQWAQVDGAFRQARFEAAAVSFRELHARLSLGTETAPSKLAAEMQATCETLGKLELELSRAGADRRRWLIELEQHRREFQPEKDADSPTAGDAQETDSDGLPIGLSFDRAARWGEVLTWLNTRARKLSQSLSSQPTPEAEGLAVLDEMLDLFDRSRQPSAELRQLAQELNRKRGYWQAEEQFRQLAQQSEMSLETVDVAAARSAWREVRWKFGKAAVESVWNEHQQRLRLRLLESTRASITLPLPPQLGRRDSIGPDVLPVAEFAAFMPVQSFQTREPSPELTFVRHDDRCYALDAATGKTRWICRVGYDARWLPQAVNIDDSPTVLVTWEHREEESLALVRAADASAIWSWHLPPGATLAGPPLAIGRRLYVWLSSGELWQLNGTDGSPQSFLKVPHGASGPLSPRVDGQGAAVSDRNLAVYVIEFGETLSCHDVCLPEPGENTLDVNLVWMSPFLLVFANELTDRCRIIVLRETDSLLREVQREDIVGRLWQTPAVHGTSLLVVSDLGSEAVQRLQVNLASRPLFTVFQQPGPPREWPSQPFVLSHARAPFVAAIGPKVVRYAVNPLETQISRERELKWEFTFPRGDTVPLQLQSTSVGIVAVGQSAGQRSPFVQSLDFETGKPLWATRVGNPVVESYPAGGDSEWLLRTETGDLFRHVNGRLQRLARLSVNDTVDYSRRHSALAWVEPLPPELRYHTTEGSVLATLPLTSRAIAPVALLDGPLSVGGSRDAAVGQADGDDAIAKSGSLPGPWVAILDADRRLHCKSLGSPVTTQFAQLAQELPNERWWRPLWVASRGLLLSHPRGDLLWFLPQQTGGIVFPREKRSVKLQAGLALPPVSHAGAIWVSGRDSHLRVLAEETFELHDDVQLPDVPSSSIAFGSEILVGLTNGHVAVLDASPPKLRLDVAVSQKPISHVLIADDGDCWWAIDAHGELTEWNRDGKLRRRERLSGSISSAPARVRDDWLLPTTAGELVRLRGAQP